MSWHSFEKWIERANHHSSFLGKFWITFLIVCRMVIVASVGERVYNDDHSEFKCNTLQPGCIHVCFNLYSQISHLRFWSFQILLVATPSLMFVVYSCHIERRPHRRLKLLMTRISSNPNRRSKPRRKEGKKRHSANTEYSSKNPKQTVPLMRHRNIPGGMYSNNNKSLKTDKRHSWQEVRWSSVLCVAENCDESSRIKCTDRCTWKKPQYTSLKKILKEFDPDNIGKDNDERLKSSFGEECTNSALTRRNRSAGKHIDETASNHDGRRRTEINNQTEKDENNAQNEENRELSLDMSTRDFTKTRIKIPFFIRHFRVYIVSVVARLTLEIVFLTLQIILFGFEVKSLFKCKEWPCPNEVNCFISRPTEKTIFLYFMFVYACVCIILNVAELICSTLMYIQRRIKPSNVCQDEKDICQDETHKKNKHHHGKRRNSHSSIGTYGSAEEQEFETLMQNGFGRRYSSSFFQQNRDTLAQMRHSELDLIFSTQPKLDSFTRKRGYSTNDYGGCVSEPTIQPDSNIY